MPYIVVSKNRGVAGAPKEHGNKESALGEARRLAKVDEEDEFTVYVSLTTVRMKRLEETSALPIDIALEDPPF
jgi:hypothetical protein